MANIETDVLIVGTGPAGSATAALLASYGVANMVVNRYRWLSNTPRAHITNQRTMEVLRGHRDIKFAWSMSNGGSWSKGQCHGKGGVFQFGR
jgi:2-polyprenyl-6-methoxyphenol hydroxylase-like FAD-dependent oxidoreductase